MRRMRWIRWFVAGALAVPLFHQMLLALMNSAGWISRQPFAMEATRPFGVPQVVSLTFWGGVWGVILGLVIARRAGAACWLIALAFGAVAPTLVAAFAVPPLKGRPIVTDMTFFLGGLMLNGAWGLGTAALYRLFAGTPAAARSTRKR